MGHKTMNQRLRQTEKDAAAAKAKEFEAKMERLAAQPIRDAAADEWDADVDHQRKTISVVLKNVFGREADSFPAPLKGRIVVAEVEGLLFTWNEKYKASDDHTLELVIVCPVCDEPKTYFVWGYADVGKLLANAAQDARCWDCVKAMRRNVPEPVT